MKRLLLCLLLSFALLLTACGAPAPAEPEVPEAPAPVEAEIPESPAPVETEAPEPESESNLIGISMPTKYWRWNRDGSAMQAQLQQAGYEVDLQYADNDDADNDVFVQISQLEAMIENGAKVLIIAAIDSNSLSDVLDKAARAGIQIIAYDRLIMGSSAVSYYCTFDKFIIPQLQAQYIADALKLEQADGRTYSIEVIIEDSDDSSINAIHAALDVLSPYFDNGTLILPSGRRVGWDTAIEDPSCAKVFEIMENILTTYYSDGAQLDAVFCSNDSAAQGVATALSVAYQGETYPIITGADCDIVSVMNILDGKQAMSVFKDNRELAAAAVEMADALMKGEEPPINDTYTYDNATGIIPTYLVEPHVVTIDNLKELLIDSGYYTPDQVGIDLLTEAGIEIP